MEGPKRGGERRGARGLRIGAGVGWRTAAAREAPKEGEGKRKWRAE